MKIIRYKEPIFGMSHPLARIQDRLADRSWAVYEHLMKLYVYSHIRPDDINGWKQSVFAAIPYVPKVKRAKGKDTQPTPAEILDAVWETHEASLIEYFIQLQKDLENPKKTDPPYPKIEVTGGQWWDLRNRCHSYVQLLAEVLPTKIKLENSDIFPLVEEVMSDII